MATKTVLLWSGGKDSMLALRELQRSSEFEVVALLTTCTTPADRVSMHDLPLALIERQAAHVGVPLHVARVPPNPPNDIYENQMRNALLQLKQQGATGIAAGDIFLEDLRAYRERQWQALGLTPVFPLWKRNTTELAHEFVRDGYRGVTVCVDSRRLDRSYIGRTIDAEFLDSLPPSVDRCGENGEFHTFVFDAPLFRSAIEFKRRAVTFRDPFWFCELHP